MYANAQEHFASGQHQELLVQAYSLSVIERFNNHPSTAIALEYEDYLAKRGVDRLKKQLVVDRGILNSEYMKCKGLPPETDMRDKVLEILTKLLESYAGMLNGPRIAIAMDERNEFSEALRGLDSQLRNIFEAFIYSSWNSEVEYSILSTLVSRSRDVAQYATTYSPGTRPPKYRITKVSSPIGQILLSKCETARFCAEKSLGRLRKTSQGSARLS
ncbi:hypothetical protein KI688_011924 [Linnemannia hyalina]|uniref:Uncharacterized protein n=1 Tax=Linnemannia hyalina TaxID=64524 RepID=A0A9P7XV11_9FUNG|nr:hypothetical protein KI688_011924 [Linnemannia hyalina]